MANNTAVFELHDVAAIKRYRKLPTVIRRVAEDLHNKSKKISLSLCLHASYNPEAKMILNQAPDRDIVALAKMDDLIQGYEKSLDKLISMRKKFIRDMIKAHKEKEKSHTKTPYRRS